MRRYAIAAIATTAVLLAGCAQSSDEPAGSAPAAFTATEQQPAALIGSWAVTGSGVAPDVVVHFDDLRLRVFDDCQVRHGEWRADQSGLFLADFSADAGSEKCPADRAPGPDWLTRAVGFRVEGDSPVLLDDAGAELARLRTGGLTRGGPDIDPSWLRPPTLSDDTRRLLAAPPELPAGLAAPTAAELVGRWLPEGTTEPAGGWPQPPFVELAADGTWTGADGCNSYQLGRWVTGADGALLATGGAATEIGCDNVSVGVWLATARQAALDGDTLVLRDAQGTEAGRLRRG